MRVKASPYVIPGLRKKWKSNKPTPSKEVVENIVGTVCAYFNVQIHEIKKRGRYREFIYPRQMGMFFLKRETGLRLREIGELMCSTKKKYDHTTVIHSVKHIQDLLEFDEQVGIDVENIKRLL